MVLVSGYLIRQVADTGGGGGGPTPSDIVGRLKRAYQLGDPLEYLKTCYVMIGSTYVDQYTVSGSTVQVKDKTSEPTAIDGGIQYGSLHSKNVRCCMYYTDYGGIISSTPAYQTVGHDSSICSLIFEHTTGSAMGELYLSNSTDSAGISYYKIPFIYSIPIFGTESEANSYGGLVNTYWTSGLDADLDAIEEYLRGHMITPE